MTDNEQEIKIDTIEQIVIVENNRPVDAYRIYFTIHGIGQYNVDVKQQGYTPALGRQAVTKKAQEIKDTFAG